MEYTILIVDDQSDNIKVLRALLREMGLGEKIHTAPNEDLALSLAKQLTPDLILTTWQMQSTDGYEWIKVLKDSEETNTIPVIMITGGKTDPVSMKAGFDAGVHDYIRKPFDKLEFFARISASLKLLSLIHPRSHKPKFLEKWAWGLDLSYVKILPLKSRLRFL